MILVFRFNKYLLQKQLQNFYFILNLFRSEIKHWYC